MKAVGLALAALAAAAPSSVPAYPLDIENDAVWLVRDALPEPRGGAPWAVEVRDLRSRDLVRGGTTVAVVCGTLDLGDADDGAARFVVFYAGDGRGAVAPIGADGIALNPQCLEAGEAEIVLKRLREVLA